MSTTEDTGRTLEVSDLLGRDSFEVDEDYAHIAIDPAICASCPHHACVAACPAQLFTRDEEGVMHFDHAGCLECGTCRIACEGTIVKKWVNPGPTMGVEYRLG